MTKANHYSVALTDKQHASLQSLAEKLGCFAKAGTKSGEPSYRRLIIEIANGTVLVARPGQFKPREPYADAPDFWPTGEEDGKRIYDPAPMALLLKLSGWRPSRMRRMIERNRLKLVAGEYQPREEWICPQVVDEDEIEEVNSIFPCPDWWLRDDDGRVLPMDEDTVADHLETQGVTDVRAWASSLGRTPSGLIVPHGGWNACEHTTPRNEA
jgi:hypothetical protein